MPSLVGAAVRTRGFGVPCPGCVMSPKSAAVVFFAGLAAVDAARVFEGGITVAGVLVTEAVEVVDGFSTLTVAVAKLAGGAITAVDAGFSLAHAARIANANTLAPRTL